MASELRYVLKCGDSNKSRKSSTKSKESPKSKESDSSDSHHFQTFGMPPPPHNGPYPLYEFEGKTFHIP